MTGRKRAQARALKFGQHVAIAGTQMFFGALTGAIRLVRGSHPEGWRTLRYGLHRDEVLDHMEPNARVKRRKPVVFFHGGGWMMGTKDFYSHDLLFLAEAGHPVFNVEYPKAPEHPHPWILRSVFKALTFIRQNFGDGGAVHLAGDSAGGNLAVMAGILCQNPDLLAAIEPDEGPLPEILSVTSLYGVMDRLTCLNPNTIVGPTMIEAYGGPEALAQEVGPAHAITPMDVKFTRHPPCFLTCGEWDPLTASHDMYAKRLTRAGHSVKSKTYAKATHGYFNFPEGAVKTACRRDMTAFLREIEDGA
ncbi:MAG: alpha/beta hydrolase [Rhodospirillaceae bacterium]|nr:alpha/beta hydrolase [Rhodospirillaceae bacterium]